MGPMPVQSLGKRLNIAAPAVMMLFAPLVASAQISVLWNDKPATSGVTMAAVPGDFDQIGILVYSASAATFTATSDQTWLTLSPTNGFMGAGISAGAFITLNADAANLTSGTYNAHVTITAAVGTATVPVSFKVGAPSTLTLAPSTMNFQYALSSRSYPAGQSSTLTVSGAADGTAFTATSLSDWVLVNGKTTATGTIGSTVTISVDAAGLGDSPAADTYTGFVYVSANGMSGILKVNLTVSGASSGGEGTYSFYVPAVGGSAAPQYVTISGSGPYLVVVTTNSNDTNWLSVSPSSGTLSDATVLKLSVNSAGLIAGTYSATVRISNGTSVLQSFAVVMYIASSNAAHLVVAPSNLTFSLPPGASQAQTVILTGGGGAYKAQAMGKGLSISPASGNTPTLLTVSVDTSAYSVGEVGVGYVVIQSNSGSQLVTATIKVLPGTVVQTNPAAISVILENGSSSVSNIQVTCVNEPPGSHQSFTVTGPSFVNLGTNSTTTPASIAMALNPALLGAGLNTGNIVITAPGAANSPLKIPVTVLSPGDSTASITLTPSALNLTAVTGGPPIKTSVSVAGIAGASITAVASSAGSWLSVTPASAASPATLTVTANPVNVGAGSYQGTVTVTTDGGLVALLNVALVVTDLPKVQPVLSLSSTQLSFNYQQGDPAPPAQTVQISASGVAARFTVSPGANWITVSQASGLTPAAVRIGVIPGGLFDGTYTGAVTVGCADAANNPQTIVITMKISIRPALRSDKTAINFVSFAGSAPPGAETVTVSSTAADLPFTVSTSSAPWLSVTPVRGTTPATLTLKANQAGMVPGIYQANLTVDGGISTLTIPLQLTVTPPLPTISVIYNAASLGAGAIAPGEILVIDGANIGPAALTKMVAGRNAVDSTLAGTRVLVGGFPAPLLYTSSTQVSAVAPYAIAGKQSTFVQVEYLQQRSNAFNVDVAPTSPGVFMQFIFNQDGSTNSPDNPAATGSTIMLYATGEGQTLPAGVDGKVAQESEPLPKPILPVSAKIDGVPAQVTYAGAAPGMVSGLLQVNVVIPADARSGDLLLTIGGKSSQTGVGIAIR